VSSVDLSMSVPGGVWQRVREVRRSVEEAGKDLPSELRTAAVMVTSELVENAVKYGESVADCSDIQVRLVISDERITVEVSNGVTSPGELTELFERVRQISESDNKEQLYMARLTELLEQPGTSGKLGLYRIGFEGKFDLESVLEGQTLTVRAQRDR
jgi:anti-sigma regulatory factor (Ser/Thr protein kinase)